MYTYHEITTAVLSISAVIALGTWFAVTLIKNGK